MHPTSFETSRWNGAFSYCPNGMTGFPRHCWCVGVGIPSFPRSFSAWTRAVDWFSNSSGGVGKTILLSSSLIIMPTLTVFLFNRVQTLKQSRAKTKQFKQRYKDYDEEEALFKNNVCLMKNEMKEITYSLCTPWWCLKKPGLAGSRMVKW